MIRNLWARAHAGHRLVSFGIFPVVAASLFQVAVIYAARDRLAELFVIQSIVAVGTSIVSLQPRTWQSDARTVPRTAWSFVFTVGFLVIIALGVAMRWDSTQLIFLVFIAKKICDAAREFFFLGDAHISPKLARAVLILECLGISSVFLGWMEIAAAAFATAGAMSATAVMKAVTLQGWTRPHFALAELPLSATMTVGVMGSRIFMLMVPAVSAQLVIGAMLQAGNFVAPVTYWVSTRVRSRPLFASATAGIATCILMGSSLLIYISGGSPVPVPLIAIWSLLLAVFTGLLTSVMMHSSNYRRRAVAVGVSIWVLVNAVATRWGSGVNWEVRYSIFAVGGVMLLAALAKLHGRRNIGAGSHPTRGGSATAPGSRYEKALLWQEDWKNT